MSQITSAQYPRITLSELATILKSAQVEISWRKPGDTGNLTQEEPAAAQSIVLTGASCDSRHVEDGYVLFCKGAAFKPDYLLEACSKGAVAFLCDPSLAGELAQALAATTFDVYGLMVSDIRTCMALASAESFGHPDRRIDVLGITGTKGKSSVAYMLRHIMDGDNEGSVASIMGSIDVYDGIESYESHNTTPEAPDVWRHLYNAAESGHTPMIMEVTSHGLKYQRVDELEFSVGAFLNIGRDHISSVEHADFDDYFESKLRIFDHTDRAVVNLDCDSADIILARAKEKCSQILTFSESNPAADVWAENIEPHMGSISFTCHTPTWTREIEVGMAGLFNVENALCAIAVCEYLGIEPEQIAFGLAHVRVPGRMEILMGEDAKVLGLVDYAHNTLSFKRFYEAVDREFPGRKVISVFGSAGDKARERRRDLPLEAAKWSDLIIYTEEDPAHEPTLKICSEMAENTPEGTAYEIIEDRYEAIERAVEYARSLEGESIVVMLGKGDETRQHRGDDFVDVDPDGDIFMNALKK